MMTFSKDEHPLTGSKAIYLLYIYYKDIFAYCHVPMYLQIYVLCNKIGSVYLGEWFQFMIIFISETDMNILMKKQILKGMKRYNRMKSRCKYFIIYLLNCWKAYYTFRVPIQAWTHCIPLEIYIHKLFHENKSNFYEYMCELKLKL